VFCLSAQRRERRWMPKGYEATFLRSHAALSRRGGRAAPASTAAVHQQLLVYGKRSAAGREDTPLMPVTGMARFPARCEAVLL